MAQIISEKVTVGMSDFPKWVKWKNRIYKIDKVGLHHTYLQGQTLQHVFSVISGTTFMKLILNTKSLTWKLEEISNEL